ncbi:MAG: von Willebrand factor type A domain-containing protein, partial [Verrucomicrobiota bacterium]
PEPKPEPIVAAAPNTMKFAEVTERPDSSFNLAVGDTSYDEVKSAVAAGEAPNLDDVRIEELVNHFSYDYAEPENPKDGIAVDMEVAECPWNEKMRLVRIGLRGEILAQVPSAAQIDVNFNLYQVRSYRLLGYTGRDGQPIDAERPTGRSEVTALYEIEPINPIPVSTEAKPEENRYGSQPLVGENEQRDIRLGTSSQGEMFQFPEQLLTLKLGDRAKIQLTDEGKSLGDASPDFRFAAAVAAFGMRLSGDGKLDYREIAALAEQGVGENTEIAKERREFVKLAMRAQNLESR